MLLKNNRMKYFLLIVLHFTIFSCKEETPTLQKYMVEKTESPSFITLDVAPSIINTKSVKLSSEEEIALKSFEKVNILALKNTKENQMVYETEINNIENILKNKDYQELLKVGKGKDKAALYFTGSTDAIEEFILFANKKENGFAVVRILGDKMNPKYALQILTALEKADINTEQFKPLQEIFINN